MIIDSDGHFFETEKSSTDHMEPVYAIISRACWATSKAITLGGRQPDLLRTIEPSKASGHGNRTPPGEALQCGAARFAGKPTLTNLKDVGGSRP